MDRVFILQKKYTGLSVLFVLGGDVDVDLIAVERALRNTGRLNSTVFNQPCFNFMRHPLNNFTVL